MDIFLIDFENVKSEGLNGILNLAKTDLVCVFWSLKEDKLKIETTEQLMKCQVPVYFYKADVGGKNALDHQLSSYLGYLIGKGSDAHYYIISNDKGYRFLADFWKRMKIDAPIELAPSIKAVKIRQQQQQQKQQNLFNEPRVERIAQKESPKLLPVKEIPVVEPVDIPEEIPAPVAEEPAPALDHANAPTEQTEERPNRKKRRGHRSRRRPKPVEETISQESTEAPVEEAPAEETSAEELPDAEVILEIPSEGIIAEVTMEAATEEKPIEEASVEEQTAELPAEEASEETLEAIPDAEVVLEIPSEGIVAEVTLEEAPTEETAPEEETPEEKAPKKTRSRSSRNRRSRAKKQDPEGKEETKEVPVEEISAAPVEEPAAEPVVPEINAEPAVEAAEEPAAAEAPAKKPAKRSRKKPAKKQPAEATVTETPAAEEPVEVPAKVSKEAPAEKATVSMEALTALIPDSKEESWIPALLEDINASRNKKELYAKVIRRLKQENGREIYHKIKKLVP